MSLRQVWAAAQRSPNREAKKQNQTIAKSDAFDSK